MNREYANSRGIDPEDKYVCGIGEIILGTGNTLWVAKRSAEIEIENIGFSGLQLEDCWIENIVDENVEELIEDDRLIGI